MNDLKINKNTAIHCPTEQLAIEVRTLLHELGYAWRTGVKYADIDINKYYGIYTCYLPHAGIVTCTKECIEIIPAIEFLKLHGYTITEEEVLVNFDMEKAKAGAKVVWGMKSKYPVRIVCYDVGRENYPLLVLVQRPEEGEVSYAYSLKGEYYYESPTPSHDLFILETTLKITPPQIKEMTIEEIERQLGFKIKIVNK